MKILCQACKRDGSGCSTCGGFGYLLEKVTACKKCGRKAWVDTRVHSSYEGKRYRTWDGLMMVAHMEGNNCYECEKAKD